MSGTEEPGRVSMTALRGIPLIHAGVDLAEILLQSLAESEILLEEGDILAVTSKIVSKAEGRFVHLDDVIPSPRATQVAQQCQKDPRLVQVILSESSQISRMRPGLLIVRHRLGFVCANAGVDQSNVSQEDPKGETVLLLPVDPDASARTIRERIRATTRVSVGVVIVDSHGRPHRLGTVGVAVGSSGIPALQDWRGVQDLLGRALLHTEVGFADQLASAASLLFGQAAEGTPVIHLRGIPFTPCDGVAAELVRPSELDLYY